jgi:hypothetical protein
MTAVDKRTPDYPASPSRIVYKQELHDLQVKLQNHKLERGRWSLADIPYDTIDPTRIAGDPYLFYMLAALYAGRGFTGRDQFRPLYAQPAGVFSRRYRCNQLAHARLAARGNPALGGAQALREHCVWPDFSWDRCFLRFLRDEIICLVRHPARNTDNCSVHVETGKGIIIQASQDKFHSPRRKT